MKQKDDYHDMIDDPFIFEEFEGTDELMRSSSLNDEYDSNEDFENLNASQKTCLSNMSCLRNEQKTCN